MRRVVPLLLSFAFALAALPSPADDGLTGVLRSPEGASIAQVPLTFSGAGLEWTAITGPDGGFRVAGLAAGEYDVAVDLPGFLLSPARVTRTGGQDQPVALTLRPAPVREHVVVAATRQDAATSSLGTTVNVVDEERITERESTSFLNLMLEVPGVAAARTGGVGSQGSVFVRGGASNSSRVLVDGVPVNEPGGAWNFGPQLPFELERVEIVKGAASSLYSTDALAGVVHLATRRAEAGAPPSFNAEAQGGSFAWQRYAGGTSGRSGAFDWNAGLLYLDTDNQEENNAFQETAGALSAGVDLGDRQSLRLLFRVDDSTVGTPGQTAYGRPDLDASFDFTAISTGLAYRRAGTTVVHEVRGGYARTDQLSKNPLDSGSFTPTWGDIEADFPSFDFPDPLGYQNDTERLSFGYQAEVQAGRRNLLTAGADVEHESGELGSRSDPSFLSPTRTNVGFFVQDRFVFGSLFATVGGRVEHNESFGTKAVPRVALAYRARSGEDATTLRGSAGAGIKEPSFFESFGESSFALGNPDLKPERSRTFDLGVDQRLFRGRAQAAVTWFHHDYRDQIAYQYDFVSNTGTYVNLGQTRAQGFEVSLAAAPLPKLALSGEYTYLDGEILVSTSSNPVYAEGQSLLRRPKHQASASARYGDGRWSAGASVVYVGERADSDFAGLGLLSNPSYTRVDARVHARIAWGLSAFLVAENLFDADYQEALGYPALGRSVRVGVRFRSADVRRR